MIDQADPALRRSKIAWGRMPKGLLKHLRLNSGLSAREAASIVGVTMVTWQRWEGQTIRDTKIPYAAWALFLLAIGKHPNLRLVTLKRESK